MKVKKLDIAALQRASQSVRCSFFVPGIPLRGSCRRGINLVNLLGGKSAIIVGRICASKIENLQVVHLRHNMD